jgi:hypothetical protein
VTCFAKGGLLPHTYCEPPCSRVLRHPSIRALAETLSLRWGEGIDSPSRRKRNPTTFFSSTDMMLPDFFFNHCFDKKRLKAFILWSFIHNGGDATASIIEEMKEKGFLYATQAGISIGLDDLQRPPQKPRIVSRTEYQAQMTRRKCRQGDVTDVERAQELVDIWYRTSEKLREDVVDHFKATDILNPVYMMAFSGARGNISQVRQLTAMRGLMADPEGRVVGFPIRSSFREGLTVTEYMISCYGARKGLVDTALRTADAGYLTRRLVDVAHHVIVKGLTCRTRRGILLREIQSGGRTAVPLKERLVGRVLAADVPRFDDGLVARRNDIISDHLADRLASQCREVLVRSPLKCALPGGVCQLCYGWNLSQRKLVTLGEAVGIIAGQSIGEPGTQLTMRTFHTGGVFSGHLVDEIVAPHDGVAHFPTPLQGLLIRTSHGRVAFLIKFKGQCILKQTGLASMRGVDTPFLLEASSVLFVRQNETVLEGELVAQAASMEEEESDTSLEGIRMIFARSAGQVAFPRWMSRPSARPQGMGRSSRAGVNTLWILAGSRLPDANPKGVKIQLNHGSVSTPSLAKRSKPPRSGENHRPSLESFIRPTFLNRRPISTRLDGVPFQERRLGGRQTWVKVLMATMRDLHREGGHLLDDRSLLAELRSTGVSATRLVQRMFTTLVDTQWRVIPPSRGGSQGGVASSPETTFQGEILPAPLGMGSKEGETGVVTAGDQLTLSTGDQRAIVLVGQFLHAGEEVASGLVTHVDGQVIRIRRGEVTLRRVETILAYGGGKFFVERGEWVEENTPVVSLPFRQLILDDIVQGIPKIEQLFEASRNDKNGRPIQNGVQDRLTTLFKGYKKHLPLPMAVARSVEEIQHILMERIIKVYLSHGVVIADKHFEVVIRQITSKVEITKPGNTGLFAGEHLSFDMVAKTNRFLPPSIRKASYRPALVGITRVALNSDSFLSAASFQSTTRVLARDALKGKVDYLRGLKQHVILGDFIPAGTGLDRGRRSYDARWGPLNQRNGWQKPDPSMGRERESSPLSPFPFKHVGAPLSPGRAARIKFFETIAAALLEQELDDLRLAWRRSKEKGAS